MGTKKVSEMTDEERQEYKKKKEEKQKKQEAQYSKPIEEREIAFIRREDMVAYINENYPKDKTWFAEVAVTWEENEHGIEKPVYHHIEARSAFLKKYFPDKAPKEKDKSPAEQLLEWAGLPTTRNKSKRK